MSEQDIVEREAELRGLVRDLTTALENRNAEITRLRTAKQRALAIADERSKENVALRARVAALEEGLRLLAGEPEGEKQ